MAEPAKGFKLRPAGRAEASALKALVRRARLNPLGLNWQRFTVATTEGGQIIGCAQLKAHGDGSEELASLVVVRPWRKKGVAAALITEVKARSAGLLWLMCRRGLVPYYERYGFVFVGDAGEMPPYFARIWRLARVFSILAPDELELAIMRWKARDES